MTKKIQSAFDRTLKKISAAKAFGNDACTGHCNSIDNAHPDESGDSPDSHSMICDVCGGSVCVGCGSEPVEGTLTFCKGCCARMDDEDMRCLEVTIEENAAWKCAYVSRSNYPKPQNDKGKWLIFVPESEAELSFDKIVSALEDGKLGATAKMAVEARRDTKDGKNKRVICVYTYSLSDIDDVRRVRASLREIGFSWKIPYKTDNAIASQYRPNIDGLRVSSLYE